MRGDGVRGMVDRLRWRRHPEPVPASYVEMVSQVDASLHADTEAICPDCLRWIGPDEYVRRNAFDMLEHEVCPPASVRARTA